MQAPRGCFFAPSDNRGPRGAQGTAFGDADRLLMGTVNCGLLSIYKGDGGDSPVCETAN